MNLCLAHIYQLFLWARYSYITFVHPFQNAKNTSPKRTAGRRMCYFFHLQEFVEEGAINLIFSLFVKSVNIIDLGLYWQPCSLHFHRTIPFFFHTYFITLTLAVYYMCNNSVVKQSSVSKVGKHYLNSNTQSYTRMSFPYFFPLLNWSRTLRRIYNTLIFVVILKFWMFSIYVII